MAKKDFYFMWKKTLLVRFRDSESVSAWDLQSESFFLNGTRTQKSSLKTSGPKNWITIFFFQLKSIKKSFQSYFGFFYL